MSKTEEKELALDQKIVSAYLKNKDIKPFHLNGVEFRGGYKISSGSKILDSMLGGGFGSGLLRFVGPTETGKTAEALEVQDGFLKQVENSKGILVKAEGRLDQTMKDRVSTKFVEDPEDWVEGTCWVFKCNVYEIVFNLLRKLVTDRDNKTRYCIIIDSMDGLISQGDLDKGAEDAPKVAAGAVMTADFLRRTNLYLGELGHLCIMMAQVRAEIRATQYTPKDKNKLGGASGGNAAVHYPNWVLEFKRPIADDYFGEINTDKKPDGRYVNVKICKSTNETTNMACRYPIKFGRKGRSAIWTEKESIDLLLSWGFIEKNGSWYATDEKLSEYLGGTINIQGLSKWFDRVENDLELAGKLSAFVDENIMSLL